MIRISIQRSPRFMAGMSLQLSKTNWKRNAYILWAPGTPMNFIAAWFGRHWVHYPATGWRLLIFV